MDESITWIDATEHLPDTDRFVLIFMLRYEFAAWIGYFDDSRWILPEGDFVKRDVTHWAELPQGPKSRD